MMGYDHVAKADFLQRRCSALLAEMKRLEREHQKTKRRADLLQKEKDAAKSELNKTTDLKSKLEKVAREATNENRRLRVSCCNWRSIHMVLQY